MSKDKMSKDFDRVKKSLESIIQYCDEKLHMNKESPYHHMRTIMIADAPARLIATMYEFCVEILQSGLYIRPHVVHPVEFLDMQQIQDSLRDSEEKRTARDHYKHLVSIWETVSTSYQEFLKKTINSMSNTDEREALVTKISIDTNTFLGTTLAYIQDIKTNIDLANTDISANLQSINTAKTDIHNTLYFENWRKSSTPYSGMTKYPVYPVYP